MLLLGEVPYVLGLSQVPFPNRAFYSERNDRNRIYIDISYRSRDLVQRQMNRKGPILSGEDEVPIVSLVLSNFPCALQNQNKDQGDH
jgi:hypothetical protein